MSSSDFDMFSSLSSSSFATIALTSSYYSCSSSPLLQSCFLTSSLPNTEEFRSFLLSAVISSLPPTSPTSHTLFNPLLPALYSFFTFLSFPLFPSLVSRQSTPPSTSSNCVCSLLYSLLFIFLPHLINLLYLYFPQPQIHLPQIHLTKSALGN